MRELGKDMKALTGDIMSGYQERKRAIVAIKLHVMVLQDNVRTFLAETRKFNEEIGNNMKADLRRGREELTENVDKMKKNFQSGEKKTRIDLLNGRQNWRRVSGILRYKRVRLKQRSYLETKE